MTTANPGIFISGPGSAGNAQAVREAHRLVRGPLDHHHATDALSFAEVPSPLAQLDFANVGAATPTSASLSLSALDAATPPRSPAGHALAHSDRDARGPDQSSSAALATSAPAALTASHGVPLGTNQPPAASPNPTPASAIRKTSPGLAARLKALGFGTSRKADPSPGSTSPPERIGRLDAHQLRQLDKKHQAGSLNPVIPRRGRPWKGAGASPSPSREAPDRTGDAQGGAAPGPAGPSHPQLPEIRAAAPLDMDTKPYPLPDHASGHGPDAKFDTRHPPVPREAVPPSSSDFDIAPPPPPKDTPPTATPPADCVPDVSSYFTAGQNRPGSIYTLSRASFTNQLAQLTSLQLPDAESLSSKVSAMPTAQVAAKALINAAEQIRSWISKALEVIGGLDSEDDVEWAAAGGREGLAEVESATCRFEELIHVYVSAIEDLQERRDIANVESADLKRAVSQMDTIVGEWDRIRVTLQNVRNQVEIAMEWEELWNNVLGDIQGEMDELSRLVFEMEERRHKTIVAAASAESVDIGDLETIVEETPNQASRLQAPNRASMPAFPMSPSSPGAPTLSLDDSSLLALFARMQPLRASLDFLPMRLSVFQVRADKSFPTACDELEMRQAALDGSYKKLEKDAEVLRKELGEDRWVLVFRGAGRQAQKMQESVERSLVKLRESIDAGVHMTNPAAVAKKTEAFEAKKTHYGPAIERVLSIIDKGVQDRLTVNGEILRLHQELQSRWEAVKGQFTEMNALLEEVHADQKDRQLRDSVSSMLSNDHSTAGSGRETPGSSPPSSVVMSTLTLEPHTPAAKPSRARSPSTSSRLPTGATRRHSSLPTPTPNQFGKKAASRLSTIPSSSNATPVLASKIARPGSTLDHRPPWNNSTKTWVGAVGHNSGPLGATTPSPYTKKPAGLPKSATSLTPPSAGSKLPSRSQGTSQSPKGPDDTPSRPNHSRLSFRERLASPGPYAQQILPKPFSSAHSSKLGAGTPGHRRSSYQPSRATSVAPESEGSRPASSLASTSRRSSFLPQPRAKKEGAAKDTRPVWRP